MRIGLVRPTPATGPAVALAALLLTAPRVLLGQGSEEELSVTARAFAAAWEEGRTRELAEGMVSGGIRLHLPDASHPVIPVRLARAALQSLHDQAGRGPVSVRQVRLLGGAPARGFVEVVWSPLPEGMTEPLRYTVFAGLEERDGAWKVVEIRVLPA
jgi:hypothetical protein